MVGFKRFFYCGLANSEMHRIPFLIQLSNNWFCGYNSYDSTFVMMTRRTTRLSATTFRSPFIFNISIFHYSSTYACTVYINNK